MLMINNIIINIKKIYLDMNCILNYFEVVRVELHVLYSTTIRLINTNNNLPTCLNNDVFDYILLILSIAIDNLIYIQLQINIYQISQTILEEITQKLYEVNNINMTIRIFYTINQIII